MDTEGALGADGSPEDPAHTSEGCQFPACPLGPYDFCGIFIHLPLFVSLRKSDLISCIAQYSNPGHTWG